MLVVCGVARSITVQNNAGKMLWHSSYSTTSITQNTLMSGTLVRREMLKATQGCIVCEKKSMWNSLLVGLVMHAQEAWMKQ